MKFAGSDYDPERDDPRLETQLERVFDTMSDGVERSLAEIAETTGDPPASVSAQLRHLRKPKHGGYTVEKEYHGNGLYLYRLRI